MIVDDSQEIREAIRRTIARKMDGIGHIYQCTNGLEAVEDYRKLLPDWVLMDIQMETMDGLEATRVIKGSFPGARIIILSGHNDLRYREAARAAGVSAYVLKEDIGELPGILSSLAQ